MLRLPFSIGVALLLQSGHGCGGTEYQPCDGKAQGAYCTLCAPDDTDCVETMEVKVCSAEGLCKKNVSDAGRATAYQPCEGKAEGSRCTICAPDDTDCVETMEVKVCSADGLCRGKASDAGR